MFEETQCPQCHTRFRVTDEQLTRAAGMVRCGRCLTAFQAYPPDDQETAITHESTTETTDILPETDETVFFTLENTQNNNGSSAPVSVYALIEGDPVNEQQVEEQPLDDLLSLDWEDSLPIQDIDIDTTHAASAIALRSGKKKRLSFRATAIIILLGLGLLTQVAIYQMPQLSRQATLRPAYQVACHLLGCTLPAQIDLAQLYHSNLVIRSLPNTPGILLVDLWLHNKANFNQQFPDLMLLFNNADEKTIASGLFSPMDYLTTNLRAMDTLPANSQIHLSFRIADPGKVATRYHLELAIPQPVSS